MGQYFADAHASPASQLQNAPCPLRDTQEAAALRGSKSYEDLMRLAQALDFQLRYRESIPVYSQAIALRPQDPGAYRKRAARYINTLQPDLAIQDFDKCLQLGGDPGDGTYRRGIACYLAGDYAAAMADEARSFPLLTDEMKIAALYWHTLSAWKSGASPALLLSHGSGGIDPGHHTAYAAVLALAEGALPLAEMQQKLQAEQSDLEYAMLAYGTSAYLRAQNQPVPANALLKSILPRDSFWICYAYIAAWNEQKSLGNG